MREHVGPGAHGGEQPPMIVVRDVPPALRPFVTTLWASEAMRAGAGARELMLPSTAAHVVVRIGERPLRVYADRDDPHSVAIGTALVNGVRTAAYCRDLSDPAATVGAVLRPGVLGPAWRRPGDELAGRHTELDELWPAAAVRGLRERLHRAATLRDRLAVFADFLARGFAGARDRDRLVGHAIARLEAGVTVAAVVAECGLSHRHLVRRFTRATGLSPKAYQRLARFGRTVELLHGTPHLELCAAAAASGYADQSHMTREFREFAGLTPSEYARLRPASARHVPWRV